MNKRKLITLISVIIFICITGILYTMQISPMRNSTEMSENIKQSLDIQNDSEHQNTNTNEIDAQSSKEETELEMADIKWNKDEEKQELEQDKKKIFIHVCGAVKEPNVYEMEEGSRVIDAIQLAGGLQKKAAADAFNQAAVLIDGQRLYIPTKEEIDSGMFSSVSNGKNFLSGDEEEKSKEAALININTATKEQLMTLTGVGEAKANSILSYRETNGKFHSKEELMQVEGIKEGVFNKICDAITIN